MCVPVGGYGFVGACQARLWGSRQALGNCLPVLLLGEAALHRCTVLENLV